MIKSETKRGKYKPKTLWNKFTCVKCNKEDFTADVKTKICKECKQKVERVCQCGCNKSFIITKYRWDDKPFIINHDKKGKTYLEIYGVENPNCGYKKGNLNLMSNIDYVQKALKNNKKNSITFEEIIFNNQYEVNTFKWLKLKFPNKIIKYEISLVLQDKSIVTPDFIILNEEDEIIEIIEVSGIASAFEKSRERNYNKILKYLKEFPKAKITFISEKGILNLYDFPVEVSKINYNEIIIKEVKQNELGNK